ncbi:hypothetical protein ACEPPN_004956 [Leptodophora sp. 'Broadleaf-Isolate-01']
MAQVPVYDKFLDHPIEIQNAVWHHALPGPHIIQVNLRRDGSKFFSDTAPPAALHVCLNSRSEALSKYTALFEDDQTSSKEKGPIYVYLNLTRDTVYVRSTDTPDSTSNRNEVWLG